MRKLPQNADKDPSRDSCQTPSYAIPPILPYIPKDWIIWESAAGEMLIADALQLHGYNNVITTDILNGQNYFDDRVVPVKYNIQLTNLPFSIKYDWLERAYLLGHPFALLAPSSMYFADTAVKLFDKFGIELIAPRQRIDFKMPNKGWAGDSQFHSSWFCWQLGIGKEVTRVAIHKPKKSQLLKMNDQKMIEHSIQKIAVQTTLF